MFVDSSLKLSCLPSPCGRLSRPPTTTKALPPERLIGKDSPCSHKVIRAITVCLYCCNIIDILLVQVSPVSLITLKRFPLDSTFFAHPTAICCSPKHRQLIGLARRLQNVLWRSSNCQSTIKIFSCLGRCLFPAAVAPGRLQY